MNKPKQKKTQVQLGRQYGVHERTIRQWEREHAPLHDAEAMGEWITRRRQYNGATGSADPQLPPPLEHGNAVRTLAEMAGGHAMAHALNHVAAPLIALLSDKEGGEAIPPKKARGTVILLQLMFVKAYADWLDGDCFNQSMIQAGGSGLDDIMRLLDSSYRGKSRPPSSPFQMEAGPAVVAAFRGNGAGDWLKKMGLTTQKLG